MEWTRPGYLVSTDLDSFDFDLIHQYLSEVAYWSPGVMRAVVEQAARNSLSFGLFEAGIEGQIESARQIGFARMITDRTTFAYLSDVFVLPAYQGKGLGTWFMACVLAHPDFQGMRRLMLVTGDAQKLYEKFGFAVVANPEQVMEKRPLAAAALTEIR